MNVCWGPDEAEARKTAHHFWPNGGLSGQMMQDLPTWTHFDEATSLVTEDDAVSSIPCGPDIGPIVESVKKFLDAGYDHLYFHQVGPDQDGFLDIWTKELQPALADLRCGDRKSVLKGKSVSVRVDNGGRRIITKKY